MPKGKALTTDEMTIIKLLRDKGMRCKRWQLRLVDQDVLFRISLNLQKIMARKKVGNLRYLEALRTQIFYTISIYEAIIFIGSCLQA